MGILGGGPGSRQGDEGEEEPAEGTQAWRVPADTGVGCEDRAGGSEQGGGRKKAEARLDGDPGPRSLGMPRSPPTGSRTSALPLVPQLPCEQEMASCAPGRSQCVLRGEAIESSSRAGEPALRALTVHTIPLSNNRCASTACQD